MASLQDAERLMSEKGAASANPMLLSMMQQLDTAVVYSKSGNIQTNQKLWDNYSREWHGEKTSWVQKMASHVDMQADLQVLGDEWAPRAHTMEIIREFILPFLQPHFVCAEVGVGGGRIAKHVVGKVGALHCFDVSKEMLARAKAVIEQTQQQQQQQQASEEGGGEQEQELATRVTYTLVTLDNQSLQRTVPAAAAAAAGAGAVEGEAAELAEGLYDFIYSFDVLPHCDLHVLYKYLLEFKRTLKVGGKCFISTADVTTPGGWSRFEAQSGATVGGFCFTSPEAVLMCVAKAGLHVSVTGERRESNVYLNRDLLLVLEKRE